MQIPYVCALVCGYAYVCGLSVCAYIHVPYILPKSLYSTIHRNHKANSSWILRDNYIYGPKSMNKVTKAAFLLALKH